MASEPQEYGNLYRQLLSEPGRAEIGDDPLRQERVIDKIQKFLDTYPNTLPYDKREDAPYFKLSLQEVYRRSLQTAIDIVKDIASLLSIRSTLSSVGFRRKMLQVFMHPDRKFYVGIWLVLLSFVLYFIDSAA
jgi:hypothetical protein